MKELYLLSNAPCPTGLSPETIVAVWNRGRVPAGQLSIPAELNARLLPIRNELAAWTYEMGRLVHNGKPLEQHLRAGDSLSMWWLSTLYEKHPKVTRNLFQALKLRALEQILEEQKIAGLTLVASRHEEKWLPEVLKKFCEKTGRSFTFLQTEPPTPVPANSPKQTLTRLYHSLPALLKALGRFPAWLWIIRRKLPRTSLPRPSLQEKPATIVTYFPNIDMDLARSKGRFRSRYWEKLHDLLNPEQGKKHRVNWVFIYYPAPQCSFPEALRLRDCFRETGKDGASFHFLEEFLTTSDIGKSLFRFAKLVLASFCIQPTARKNFHFSGSQMDLWPVLKENWADSTRGWRALERCLMREAFRRYAEWAGPQDWTIFPQENCPWERMLAQSMHESNAGPVYGAQHSTVRPTDFRYFDDPRLFSEQSCRAAMLDLWLCNGTGARDALIAGGMPPEKTGIVEALRYLYLAPVPVEPTVPAGEPARRLLIVTSFFADETDAHLATLADAASAGFLDGWDVLVKPHPYLPVIDRLKRLYGSLEPPRVVDGAIGNFLTPGTVVWASNSTTVALEAAYRKLPVLVQAAEDDVDLCPLQGLPGVAVVRTAEDVSAALADPRAPQLPPDYLALDLELPRWKQRLGL